MTSARTLDQLAAFGGTPAFAEPLHVGRPVVADRQRLLERIDDAVVRGRLTNDGPYVRELEQRLCRYLDVHHCVAVASGTTALQLAVRALDLSGEVIVPSFTFAATVHVLRWLGLAPVFCDIEPRTFTMDPQRVEACITPKTSAILAVHLWGRPCHAAALSAIAASRHVKLLFDAAQAFGCSLNGDMIGRFGDAEIFSFHATKAFHSGEGGAITTADGRLAARLRLMRNFGFSGMDSVVEVGINGKMSELSAAVGLTVLEGFEAVIAANYDNYRRYRQGIEGLPGLSLLRFDEGERGNYHYVVVDVDAATSGISRDELLRILHAENVLARRFFYPGCHRMEPYRRVVDPIALPVTEAAAERLLCLPTGLAVSSAAVATVCEILQVVIRRHVEVRNRLDAIGLGPPARARIPARAPAHDSPALRRPLRRTASN